MEDHRRLPTCNPQIYHQQNLIQSFQPDHDDEFLQQMLSALPNPNPFLHSIKPLQTSPFPSLNHEDILSSKLRSSSPMADAAAKSYLLHQQQLLISRDRNPGAGADVELTPFPSSLADADVPTFLSTPQGAADASVQALFSAFPAQHPFQAGEISAMNQPPASGQAPQRQRVRARRGQATDPHSIAERLRRERIAERMKALQELVPNANKTDKASMLDEIIDYVKFMQLQVKVLSMSRLGGAASHPTRGGERSLNNGNPAAGSSQEGMSVTEQQVLKLMEEDMGSAMQYLQGKGLCLMPISLATAISTATSIVNRQPPPPPRPHNPVFPLTANGNGHGVQAQPSSPNLSGLTVQSTRLANGDGFVNKTNPRPQA